MAQKTIDFESDILKPIGSLKRDLADLDDNKITKFYTNNNGDTALNDSDDGKIQDLMIYGKSEQAQYKGINLLNYKKETVTENGITFTYDEKSQTYKVNGTATKRVDKNIFTTTKNIYVGKKIVGCPTGGSQDTYGIIIQYFDDAEIWKKSSMDIGNGQIIQDFPKLSIDIFVKNGITVNNLVFKPMIVEDTTKTYDDFEPYVGGKPSPSPEYPQEIKAVVNPVIKTRGKNLVKASMQTATKNGITCVNNGDGTYTMNGTATGQTDFYIYGYYDNVVRVLLDSRKTYIVKKSGNSNVQHIVGIADIYKVTAGIGDTQINNQAGISFFLCRILSGATLNNFTIYPQVEEGSVSTDFKPYQETQATLPYELYAIPVSSGGNVTIDGQQYIADYVDVERGKLVRMTELIEYDGTENWSLQSINNNGIANFQIIVTRYIGSIGMCDTLQLQKTTISNTNTEGFMINNNNSLFIRINTTRGISTLETFKEFLANKHIFILYALSTPTEIDLVKEEITAFKALSTYYPKTYINAESEQLSAYTMFNYPVSMEKGWEYVKQQIGDTRKYVYDMDLQSAEAYVNSEYAVALTELEV